MSSALITHQNWMGDNWNSIKDKKLSQICLPGTHNSGAFNLQASVPTAGLAANWANCQRLSTQAQLLFGVRSLDLRFIYIGAAENPDPMLDEVRVTHSSNGKYPDIATFTGRKAEEEFQDIKTFLVSHPREIVVVQISTTSFTDAVHRKFATRLADVFADNALVTFSERGNTFAQLADNRSSGRLVVIYRSLPDNLRSSFGSFWYDGCNYAWANTMSAKALYESGNNFIQAQYRGRGDFLYDAGLQLTESEQYVIDDIASRPWVDAIIGGIGGGILAGLFFIPVIGLIVGGIAGAIVGAIVNSNRITSVEQMAQLTNPLVFGWLKFAWVNKTNIFSVDYIDQGGDLVGLAVEINTGAVSLPPAGPVVNQDTLVYLQSQTMRYPGIAESWMAMGYWVWGPRLTPDRSKAVGMRLVKKEGGTVQNGDRVAIVTNDSARGEHNRLGAFSTPVLYYWKDEDSWRQNETWIIHKADTSDPAIHVNDEVYFVNEAYVEQGLVPQDNGEWLTTTKAQVPFLWRLGT